MGIINRLPRDVYDKIAAGEVVERPASVIKELVENSIDAGATKITVEIKNGGSTYMKVVDNGCGMAQDDAETAFLRYATSKISTADDLEAIATMGFRGEALASIGAVSQAELFTKRGQDDSGTHVVCYGGEIRRSQEVGTPDGTIFIIENLFYNVPARMKFLKKDATEAGYISNIMSRFILAYPEISFRFINNSKETLFSAGDNNLKNSIYSVYGKNYAGSAIEFDMDYNGVRVYGAIGKGDTSRPNRDYQSCFVNRRYVKSALVFRAIEEAYKNQVMIGKFPMAVINIELNPSMIDINVHPTKLEVKFSEETRVYQAVYHSVKEALYSVSNIPKIEKEIPKESFFMPKTEELNPPPKSQMSFFEKREKPENLSVNEERVSLEIPRKPHEKEHITAYNVEASMEYFKRKQEEIADAGKDEGMKKVIDHIVSNEISKENIPAKTIQEKEPEAIYKEEELPKPVRIVGQVFDTYIIAQRGNELLYVDQHAAHERLMYEKLKEDIKNKKVFSQVMLVPAAASLNPLEYAAYKEYEEKIKDMGFEVEDFGDNTVLIRSAPYDLETGELENLFIEIVNGFMENKNEVISEKQDRLLYTIACKAAIKANHALTQKEQEELVKKVLDFNNINTCPHGRPITISMSKKELEKLFGRIV